MRTEGGDNMVRLGGGRKQRWRRGALLLSADTRDLEMGRARWCGEIERRARQSESHVQTDTSGWTPVSKYFRISIYIAKLRYQKSQSNL
jgi:hypothetical protein